MHFSATFLHLKGVLSQAQLLEIDILFEKSHFVDGRITASNAAQSVKNNMQIDQKDQATLPHLQTIVGQAILQHPLFQSATFAKQVHPLIFSRYFEKMTYGWHVDSPLMGMPAIRTDMAMTVFLSNPDEYEGGELMIQTPQGMLTYKPSKGDAVIYPCKYLHCVSPITKGERRVAISWLQSAVRSPEHRDILFSIKQLYNTIYQRDSTSSEANELLQTYSNLLRIWAEV